MTYLLLALITIAIGVLPLVIRGRLVKAAILGGVSLAILWPLFYFMIPSTVYPFYGAAGVFAVALWGGCLIIDMLASEEERDREDGPSKSFTWVFPVVGIVLLIGSAVLGWNAFNWRTYANMTGPVDSREWTQDVQPKDERHMVMVSYETALYLARKAVAQGGSIGSQFSIDTTHFKRQRVKGELVYIFPLDYAGFSVWWNSPGVPAYIKVYAEDPERTPVLVNLPQDKLMHYTPEAFWGNNLERHLRTHGYLGKGLADFHLELDEEENIHWVVTTYEYAVTWFAERITGGAVVDPSTGEITPFGMDDIPAWIDRVVPSSFVSSYLTWRGELSGGWLNSWWGKLNLTEPESPNLIYGEGDKAEFVSGITSKSGNDDSMLGLVYTDSRSGKMVYYEVNGGATDQAIVRAVEKNSQVQFRHLHATTPQIYNVYGVMAAVVPLVNDTGAFQGVAIAQLMNVQDVAVGTTQRETLRNFQSMISRQGQQVALSNATDRVTLSGVVSRIRQDVNQTSSPYLFVIEGAPRIFVGSAGDHVKLPVTQPGDRVTVTYMASGESQVSVVTFDNEDIDLDQTKMQVEVERAAKARADAEQKRVAVKDVKALLGDMSTEELQQLQQKLRQ